MNPEVRDLDMGALFGSLAVQAIDYRMPWASAPPGPTPVDSPLKVWDGSAWVAASAPPTS